MSERQWLICLIPISYLVGSIPIGLLVGLAKGVDVRKAGSGNIGATNVGRLLGKRFFFIVFFFDLLKGLGMMLLGGLIVAKINGAGAGAEDMSVYVLWLAVGFA